MVGLILTIASLIDSSQWTLVSQLVLLFTWFSVLVQNKHIHNDAAIRTDDLRNQNKKLPHRHLQQERTFEIEWRILPLSEIAWLSAYRIPCFTKNSQTRVSLSQSSWFLCQLCFFQCYSSSILSTILHINPKHNSTPNHIGLQKYHTSLLRDMWQALIGTWSQ